jgi:branched-chain amino acid transport system ATP-binding protein
MLKPRKGSIKLAGEELIGRRSDQVVRAGMVQVPQGREVFASMTVKDNLEMGAATRRGSAEIQADMKDLFAFFPRLLEKKDRMAGALSGGEQQQVAIARALMGRPRVLLMDEPSVGLSPRVVDGMIETIKRLNRERRLTILIAEQNVGVAASVASWAYVLRDGRIALSEPAPKLIGNPQVLSSYLGR